MIPGHARYITTHEFNKFAKSIFNTKLKQANLETNSDVALTLLFVSKFGCFNFVSNIDLANLLNCYIY